MTKTFYSAGPRSRSGRRIRESSINERRTMHDLETSVRNASDLLERRRLAKEASTSSYLMTSSSAPSVASSSASSSFQDVPRERGRDTTKRSTGSTYSRSSATSSASDETAAISLRGLLDFAQSWLTNHKSRREVSMERASLLFRRSRHHY